jgi:hypothetical protein
LAHVADLPDDGNPEVIPADPIRAITSGWPTIHQAKQNLLNECNPDFSPIDKNRPKIAAGRGVRPY